MVKKVILAIALIGIGCVGFFVFFVGYEEEKKMSQDILPEEPSVVGTRSPQRNTQATPPRTPYSSIGQTEPIEFDAFTPVTQTLKTSLRTHARQLT